MLFTKKIKRLKKGTNHLEDIYDLLKYEKIFMGTEIAIEEYKIDKTTDKKYLYCPKDKKVAHEIVKKLINLANPVNYFTLKNPKNKKVLYKIEQVYFGATITKA